MSIDSYDLFDTLITRRTLFPDDIFLLTEKILKRKFKSKEVTKWRMIRTKLDREMTSKYFENDYNYEIIFNEMLRYFKKEVINFGLRVERKLEYSMSVPVKNMKKYFHIRKIIVTDTYMTECSLMSLLAKSRINYEHIFVSNLEGATKRSGKMFTKLKIKYNYIIKSHTGDNVKSDFIMPKGILKCKAILVKNIYQLRLLKILKLINLINVDVYLSLTFKIKQIIN